MKIYIKYFVLIVFILTSGDIFGQQNVALKNLKKTNVEVKVIYLSGDNSDYNSLYLNELKIKSDVILMLRLAGIQVDESLQSPSLIIEIHTHNNVRNNSSGSDGRYYLEANLYFKDKVKLKRNSRIEVEAVTWDGGFTIFSTPQNNSLFESKYVSDLALEFISSYLEVNPK